MVPKPPAQLGRENGAPLSVQVRDQYGPYTGVDVVTILNASGMPVLTLNCQGAWANFELKPAIIRFRRSTAAR